MDTQEWIFGILFTFSCVAMFCLVLWLRSVTDELETKTRALAELSAEQEPLRKGYDRAINLLARMMDKEPIFSGSDRIMDEATYMLDKRDLRKKVEHELGRLLPSNQPGIKITSGTPIPPELLDKVMEGIHKTQADENKGE